MYQVLKSAINPCCGLVQQYEAPVSAQPDSADPWLFTDPAAKVAYAYQQRLHDLRDDIVSYCMYRGRWGEDELELKREIRRLLTEGALASNGTIGYLSPHPTVYRARRDGLIQIGEHRLRFAAGEDIVFVPWLARTAHPGQIGPVYIGRMYDTYTIQLCCEAYPSASRLCGRALEVLHDTLYAACRDKTRDLVVFTAR